MPGGTAPHCSGKVFKCFHRFLKSWGGPPPPHFQIQAFYGPLATMNCKLTMGRTCRNSRGVPPGLNGHDQIESWPEIGGGYPLAFYLPTRWDDRGGMRPSGYHRFYFHFSSKPYESLFWLSDSDSTGSIYPRRVSTRRGFLIF